MSGKRPQHGFVMAYQAGADHIVGEDLHGETG